MIFFSLNRDGTPLMENHNSVVVFDKTRGRRVKKVKKMQKANQQRQRKEFCEKLSLTSGAKKLPRPRQRKLVLELTVRREQRAKEADDYRRR